MTHLPYHGDANAAAQDMLTMSGPHAETWANLLAHNSQHPAFWRDVATLLRLESQDDDPGPCVVE